MAKRRNAAQMARLVAQWQRSGVSGARFGRRHGVSGWSLWYWRRKLAHEDRGASTAAPFVAVHVKPDPEPSPIAIVLPDGVRVVVQAGTPVAFVREVVAGLQRRC